MNMTSTRLYRMLLAGVVVAAAACAPEPEPADLDDSNTLPVSAADFATSYPDRAERLFAALDLEQPGLETVKAAVENNDLATAGETLIANYKASGNGSWLRDRTGVHDPGGFDQEVVEMAQNVLKDDYLLQGVRGPLKRFADSHIDWHDQGSNDDFQWTIFVNRHFSLLPLQKAWNTEPDDAYLDYINAFIQDWVASNYPPAEGESDKHLPANWRPMSSASRLLQVWPQLFYYFLEVDGFSDATRLAMLSSVPEQMEHLLRYHRRKHNHAIKEMSGLGHAAAAFPEFKRASYWTTYSIEQLSAEAVRQVYPSGVQKELTSHYQRTVLDYLSQYVAFSRAAGITLPGDFVALIESMGNFLARSMTPDGHVILNNDSDRDYVRDKVLGLADMFGRDDWRYVATGGGQGAAPDGEASTFFGFAGQLVSRSAWGEDAQWSWFDLGPWGVSHQHNDRLHLSLSHSDRNFLVDTGRVYYKPDDPVRKHILSTAAHNTILIDGAGQGPQYLENKSPMQGVSAIRPAYDFAVGNFDEGYEGIEGTAEHTRALFYLRGCCWLVVDRIETDRPRKIQALWHFHPDNKLATVGQSPMIRTLHDEGFNFELAPISNLDWEVEFVSGQMEPEVQGWYSPVYNTLLPAPTAIYTTQIEKTAIFAWAINTFEGEPVPYAYGPIPLPTDGDSLGFSLATGDGGCYVTVRLAGDKPVAMNHGYSLDGWLGVRGLPDGPLVAGGKIVAPNGEVVAEDTLD